MERKDRILLVEDDPGMGDLIKDTLTKEGYEVEWVEDGIYAKELVKRASYDLLITDLYLSKFHGPELLDELQSLGIKIPTIVVTGRPDSRQIVKFIKSGVYDYLTKPLNMEEFLVSVRAALLISRSRAIASQLEKEGLKAPLIIGKSDKIKQVKENIERVADLDCTVLILGESGTGKELVARNIHFLGQRRERMFVPVNCGAIPETLLESELFGHEKGAFTGAVFRKLGLFEMAHQGTIFLDEIGEMSPMLQIKLLRVLEDGVIRSVGSVRDVYVDVRVVTATNKDLKVAVEDKTFREDLYYRLNVVPIHLPALREREQDIPLLVQFFIEKHELKVKLKEEAMRALRKYPWPGNVRELENVLVRISILSQGKELGVDALPHEIGHADLNDLCAPSEEFFYKKAKVEFEKRFFSTLLAKADGDVTKAARLASVSKSYIYDIIKKHNLQIPTK
jgi:DNA-binding NtrC family response regulator